MDKNIYISYRFYIISGIFTVLILSTGILNHYFFRTYAFDYAAYNFAWYDFAHLKSSESPIYWVNDMSFFQDHFSFTLIILAPLYWIFTPIFGTYSLLIIQTIFVFFGSLYVYKIIKLKTGNEIFSLAGLILYFISYGRFASLVTDCNLVIILASLVPAFLYFFEQKKIIPGSSVFAFIILGRENMSLWFIFIGIFLFVTHRKQRDLRNCSILIIIISFIYFILAFTVFIPAIQNPERPFSLFNYGALGKNPLEAAITLFTNPEKAFSLLIVNHLPDIKYNFVKAEFYFVYMLSGGILLFFRPRYLLIFIPIIAQKMYNDAPTRWSIESYYSIETVTVLPVAFFLILNEIKFQNHSETSTKKIKYFISATVLLTAGGLTINKLDLKHRTVKNYPVQKNVFYNKKMYNSDLNIQKINKYLKTIPDKAKVSATGAIASHLAFRPKIYYFPRVDDAEYIILLQNSKIFKHTKQKTIKLINNYVFDKNRNIIVNDFPLIIIKNEPNTIKTDTIICNCEKTDANNQYFIYDNKKFENANLQTDETIFQGKYSVKTDSKNIFALTTKLKNLKLGTHLKINIMKYGNSGALVCSAKNPKILYEIADKPEIKFDNGWEKLELNIIIDEKTAGKPLKIYVWNNGKNAETVYFDNLEILIK